MNKLFTPWSTYNSGSSSVPYKYMYLSLPYEIVLQSSPNLLQNTTSKSKLNRL